MNTQSHHTPTPWFVNVSPGECVQIYKPCPTRMADDVICEVVGIGLPRKEANAAFIIRAVNAHEEFLWFVRDFLRGDVSDRELTERGRELIAKAEGK